MTVAAGVAVGTGGTVEVAFVVVGMVAVGAEVFVGVEVTVQPSGYQ